MPVVRRYDQLNDVWSLRFGAFEFSFFPRRAFGVCMAIFCLLWVVQLSCFIVAGGPAGGLDVSLVVAAGDLPSRLTGDISSSSGH